jgi:hypothetical protein
VRSGYPLQTAVESTARGRTTTVVVAATTILALGAGCFALLAGVLGRPTSTTVQLVDSLRAESAICRTDRIERSGSTSTRCLRPVVGRLGRQLVEGATVETTPAEIDGRRGFMLQVADSERRFVVFLPHAGGVPIALAVG